MRVFTRALCLAAAPAAAQEPVPIIRESTRAESTPPPVPPTLEQLRYLEGLRTAGRGVAKLKDGLNRLSGYHRDSMRLRQAARRLGGLCGTARGFMTSGRGRMQAK